MRLAACRDRIRPTEGAAFETERDPKEIVMKHIAAQAPLESYIELSSQH